MLVGKKGPYTLMVMPDEDAQNPREHDNLGRMVCFRRWYNWGDKHDSLDKDDFLREMYLKTVGNDEKGAKRYERMLDMAYSQNCSPKHSEGVERATDERMLRVIEQKFIMLPIFSGISTGITALSCNQGGGQVGWVYTSKENALRRVGGKVLSAEKRKKAENLMLAEVEAYCAYLRNECHGYELYKNGILEDSRWSLLGPLNKVCKIIEEHMPVDCKGIIGTLTQQDNLN